MIKFTVFEGAETLEGVDVEVPWESFVEFLKKEEFPEVAEKKQASLLLPVEFKEGATGKDLRQVLRVSFGVLDYDEITDAQIEQLYSTITEVEKLSFFMYPTWGNYGCKDWKIRVMIPFSRPVEVDEWEVFWHLFNGLLGGFADGACKDPSRGYFLPARPKHIPKDDKGLWKESGEGKCLDVDFLLSSADTSSVVRSKNRENKEKIDRDRLVKFAQRMSRSSAEYKSWMGLLILKMLKGEVFAEEGERDNTVYKMAQDLGKEFFEVDPQSIARHFGASLSLMGNEPTVDLVADKISRAQAAVQEEEIEKQKREIKKRQAEIQKDIEAKGKAGAPRGYDQQYITDFCNRTGCGATWDSFINRYIVQSKNRYYVYRGDGYHAYDEKELVVACRDLFRPTKGNHHLSIYNVNDKGFETMKTSAQLVNEYGVIADRVVMANYIQSSFYSEEDNTFYEAVSPRKALTAKEHPEVDLWLRQVCAEDEKKYAKVRKWLSLVPELKRALAMLVIVGPPGIGKTEFARGVAKLWKEPVVPMGQAFNAFNYGVTRNPVLLADEELPKAYTGAVLSEKIRDMISATEHSINEKFKSSVNLQGCLRFIAALNNRDKLKLGKQHNKNDLEAIDSRFLILEVPNDRKEEVENCFDYDLFVTNCGIAEHILWLQDNLEEEEEQNFVRFGVVSDNQPKLDLVLDEVSEHVFDWCFQSIHTRRLEDASDIPCFVHKGQFFVNAAGLIQYWNAYTEKEERIPRKTKLMNTLSVIANPSSMIIRTRFLAGRKRYWSLKTDLFLEYVKFVAEDEEAVHWQLAVYSERLYQKTVASVPKKEFPTEEEKRNRKVAQNRLTALGDMESDDGLEEDEEA